MKQTHLELTMSVCPSFHMIQLNCLTEFDVGIMPLEATINSCFLVSYNQLYQYGGRTYLWGESNTDAT
jgi:hypothetical protein